jgi:ABC-type amino acid transport substrate-binding protein
MRTLALALLASIVLATICVPATAQEVQIDVVARVSGTFVAPAGTEPPGFDVELLRRFASWHQVKTGKPARLNITYASTVPALLEAIQQGSDVGIGGVTATAERARIVDFTTDTLPVRSVVVAPPGVLEAATWRQQLRGLRLGATVGSTNAAQVDRVAASIGDVRVDNSFTTNEAVFAALAGPSRALDAAIVDLPQYWTTGKAQGLVMVDSVGEPENMAFVLPKGSMLRPLLDQFLASYTVSSGYFDLVRKYFGNDAEKMVRMARGS